jgi:hypothetical protein
VKELRRQIEDLKKENGELACHLEKSETLLHTRIEIEKEKENIYNSDKQLLQL